MALPGECRGVFITPDEASMITGLPRHYLRYLAMLGILPYVLVVVDYPTRRETFMAGYMLDDVLEVCQKAMVWIRERYLPEPGRQFTYTRWRKRWTELL